MCRTDDDCDVLIMIAMPGKDIEPLMKIAMPG
jgi:hypothetical protein